MNMHFKLLKQLILEHEGRGIVSIPMSTAKFISENLDRHNIQGLIDGTHWVAPIEPIPMHKAFCMEHSYVSRNNDGTCVKCNANSGDMDG